MAWVVLIMTDDEQVQEPTLEKVRENLKKWFDAATTNRSNAWVKSVDMDKAAQWWVESRCCDLRVFALDEFRKFASS